jgi:hypothetical protein
MEGLDMVAEWITSLAATGGATLVAAAATDAWQHAKAGFARLFGRGDRAREVAAARRLDTLASEVEQVPPAQRAELLQRLRDDWRVRLADLIEDDPTIAEALRPLVEQIRALLPAPQQQWVVQQTVTASAQGATAQGVVGGSIINHPTPAVPPQP